jgi:2-alkyl-3-oxoalkanoate reductase
VAVSKTVRVALVGCGRIARVHRGYLRQIPHVEIVGVWDANSDAARAFVEGDQLRCFASLAELLSQGAPDAVHVLTPPWSHAELAIEILRAGVSVLIEKPMAMNGAEADAILAARSGRCWVTVDHNRWFDPVVQDAAARLDRGRLGRLVGVEVFQGAEAADSGSHWSTNLPGGVLHNLVSHPLYLMRRFAGPVGGLRVVARQEKEDKLEEVRLVADGERALAAVTLSTRTRPFMNRLTLLGTEGTAEVNLNNMTLIERRPRRLPKVLGKVWPNLSEAAQLLWATTRNGIAFAAGRQRYYPGIGAHLRCLYENVAAGQPPPVTAEEGRDVTVWYDQILAQANVGCGNDEAGEA